MSDPEDFEAALRHDLLDAVREGAACAQNDDDNERDRQAIDDERIFIARFGFDRPRRYRESLIKLKHTVDLTDREIRLMHHTFSLRSDAQGVQLNASRGLAVLGHVVLGILCLQMINVWVLARHASMAPPMLAFRFSGLMIMLLAMGWFVHWVYIRPWQIQQRTRAQ
ncbi:MAG: hypothetical protein J0I74_10260 [Rhodanobacter sp.]|uniref:Uncharacterized protein n=1 Tax=Rhodanobacter geophilus TaxID=3162488 RepID=A0ABV3QP92_9GAMM|nr:hypothetical protein [Rhodanobacter sp.]MDN5872763.1 hypothetical protein [Nevskiaceae bacterium]